MTKRFFGNKMLKSGFTLVELLVVIALISAIALIVIAAINPIEQANRSRDTKFRADAGQLISAIERHYAGTDQFPWVGVSGGPTTNDAALPFVTAGSSLIGICGASCAADGALITNNELKQEFRNRDFIKDQASSDATKLIQVGKISGSSASVYACYVPLSNSQRQRSCAEDEVYTLGANGTRTLVTSTTCTGATWNNAWHICLPQ